MGDPEGLTIDHAIECVGGDASQKAIDQMIDLIQPEGTIALLGVSEYAVPINTRMVLEKGLHLYGSSRSGRADFEKNSGNEQAGVSTQHVSRICLLSA